MNHEIYPCLWFKNEAREAADLYCRVFEGSVIKSASPIVVMVDLQGQQLMLLNSSGNDEFNPAISIFVVCEKAEETDRVWNLLVEHGKVLMALDKYPWSEKYGWLQDRFGVSWQVSLGKLSDVGQKFSSSLLFVGSQHGRAEEAMNFYTGIFKNSSIDGVRLYPEGGAEPAGTVQHARFRVNDHVFMAMDSAHDHPFSFNESVSFVVTCDTQEEIDYFWDRLTEGGQESMCGWLKDKFGISWQVVPAVLGQLMSEPGRTQRVMQAFMKMKKFDIQKLLSA